MENNPFVQKLTNGLKRWKLRLRVGRVQATQRNCRIIVSTAGALYHVNIQVTWMQRQNATWRRCVVDRSVQWAWNATWRRWSSSIRPWWTTTRTRTSRTTCWPSWTWYSLHAARHTLPLLSNVKRYWRTYRLFRLAAWFRHSEYR